MINLSINSADFREFPSRHSSLKVSQSFHETETLYELVAEGVFDNTIPDNEDQDTDATFEIIDFASFPPRHFEIQIPLCLVEHYSFYKSDLTPVYPDPIALPPRQA